MSRLAGSLVAAGVSKSYGAEVVLEDVSLVVQPRARSVTAMRRAM